MELLLFEDPLDRAHPGAVGAAAVVFELVAGAPIHAEVEEDEIGPRLDRNVGDVDTLVASETRGPDMRARRDENRDNARLPRKLDKDVEVQAGGVAVREGGE